MFLRPNVRTSLLCIVNFCSLFCLLRYVSFALFVIGRFIYAVLEWKQNVYSTSVCWENIFNTIIFWGKSLLKKFRFHDSFSRERNRTQSPRRIEKKLVWPRNREFHPWIVETRDRDGETEREQTNDERRKNICRHIHKLGTLKIKRRIEHNGKPKKKTENNY